MRSLSYALHSLTGNLSDSFPHPFSKIRHQTILSLIDCKNLKIIDFALQFGINKVKKLCNVIKSDIN